MNILITGVQNVIKDSIVKLALERLGSKVKFKVLSFSDFVEDAGDSIDELGLLKSTQQKLTKNIQLKVLGSGANEHVIVNGYCIVQTKLGFTPVITMGSVDILKPDLIVYVEVDPIALGSKLKNKDDFLLHQSIELECATSFSALSGSAIKIIKAGPEGSRKGSDELYNLLKAVLVVK
jgi:adenylate kinase